MNTTTELDILRTEPHRFTWGRILNIHDVGPRYTILEYRERMMNSRALSDKVCFFVYVDGKDVLNCAGSFDEALILAVAHARLGINGDGYATRFIMKMLTPETPT